MLDTGVSSLHNLVDDLRGASTGVAGGAFRYVRHVQALEPYGVGPNGNGDSSKVTERSVYEDHLVEVALDTGSCADTIVFAEVLPDRVIEFRRAHLRHVPKAWRASVRIVADALGGFRVE